LVETGWPLEVAHEAPHVEAHSELVLAEVHARAGLCRAAQGERDGRGKKDGRTAGHEPLAVTLARQPQARRGDPGPLREKGVEAIEERRAPEEREFVERGPPQQILDRAQRAGDLASKAVQDLRGLGRSVAEARAEHSLLALGAFGVRRRETPVGGQRLADLPAGQRQRARGDGPPVEEHA